MSKIIKTIAREIPERDYDFNDYDYEYDNIFIINTKYTRPKSTRSVINGYDLLDHMYKYGYIFDDAGDYINVNISDSKDILRAFEIKYPNIRFKLAEWRGDSLADYTEVIVATHIDDKELITDDGIYIIGDYFFGNYKQYNILNVYKDGSEDIFECLTITEHEGLKEIYNHASEVYEIIGYTEPKPVYNKRAWS